MTLDDVELRAGDVVLFRGTGWLASGIRFFSRHRGEAPTHATHTGIMADDYGNICEALWKVKIQPLTDDRSFEVFRPPKQPKKSLVLSMCLKYHKRAYGYTKILFAAPDGLLGKVFGRDVFLFRRLGFWDKVPHCSFLVDTFLLRFGIDIGVDPRRCTPDDIHDHCLREGWECVYSNLGEAS